MVKRALALAAGLASAELLLAAAGAGYARWRLGPRERAEGALTVLCVGDSFTFGVGAPRGGGYPERLQALLERPGRPVRVVNAGLPGGNSSMLLDGLESLLDEHGPAVVLVLTGWNNNNLRQSHFWKVVPASRLGWGPRLRLQGRALIERSRLWRLLRLALSRARRALRGPPRPSPLLELGERLRRSRDHRGALEAYRRAAGEAGRLDGEAHYRMGWMLFLFRRMEESEAALKEALRRDPGHEAARTLLGQFESRALGLDRAQWYEPLLSYDLSGIAELARRRGAAVLFQTYPNAAQGSLNASIAKAVGGLPGGGALVDHAAAFARRPAQRRYFSGDEPDFGLSHPNADGYRLMAQTLAAELRARRLVE